MSTFYKLMSFHWAGTECFKSSKIYSVYIYVYSIVLTIFPSYNPDQRTPFNFHISFLIPKLSKSLFPFLLQKVYINVYNNHFLGYIYAYRS